VVQIHRILSKFDSLGFTSQIIIGGTSKKKISENILIVTPGRFLDVLDGDGSILNDLSILVFDEAGIYYYIKKKKR
jgi:superfamily II DNA/RNA helicase